MFQGKLTSLFGQKNYTTLMHRLQSRYFLCSAFVFLECSYSHQDAPTFRLRKNGQLGSGNTCRKKLQDIKRVSCFRSPTGLPATPALLTKTRAIFSSLHLLQNYLFSGLFTQQLGKVMVSISGRKACFI